MDNLLNAISLPFYLIILGFILSFVLYLYIQFLTEGISKGEALFFVFLILCMPLILFFLSIRYLFTNKFSLSDINDNNEEDSLLTRLLIVILMMPVMVALFVFRPAKVANRIIKETVNAIEKARENQVAEVRFTSSDEVALREILGGVFEKVILRGRIRSRLIH